MEHTRRAYDRTLASLTDTILEMGRAVQGMLDFVGAALLSPDGDLVEQARQADKQVNELERRIEQQVTELLALQNPMAIDLRYTTAASKIAGSLERMGDLAKNTVRQIVPLGGVQDAGLRAQYEEMHAITREMLEGALYSYTHLDAQKATEIWQKDDAVDDICDAINARIVDFMRTDPSRIERHMQLMFASKNIERIADYATKIAKIVHFVTSGQQATKASLQAQASALLSAGNP